MKNAFNILLILGGVATFIMGVRVGLDLVEVSKFIQAIAFMVIGFDTLVTAHCNWKRGKQ